MVINWKCKLIAIFLLEPRSTAIGRGRLTERLLAQGLLTPTMLEELQHEWNRQSNTTTSTTESASPRDDNQPKKGPRRKRKP